MADPRTQLQKKFEDANRYANFGNVLVRLDVQGFRLHARTVVDFRSAVTAFCGPNGTGKTTLIQLAACAYRKGSKGFQLRDFFAVGPLDSAPFDRKAQLAVSVRQSDGKNRQYTLSRRPSRWSDYRVREERDVMFLGSGHFLPRVERKDFAFRNASRLTVGTRTPCAAEVMTSVARILGLQYDTIERTQISVRRRTDSLLASSRGALRYSEIHMGFGESRVHNIVETLESQPEKSLILLEEPEISLHQAAQYRLGEYLVTLAIRKGHQIVLSTHSEHLLRALPQASRVLVTRSPSGAIQILPGLTSAQAASLMAEGHDVALTVLVEDDVAKAILTELLASLDGHFLTTTRIASAGYRDDDGRMIGGGEDAIRVAMRVLRDTGLHVAAVLDADMPSDPGAFVFVLPGTQSPEQEIFASAAVCAFWTNTYSIDIGGFKAGVLGVNHHEWFDRLAGRVNRSRELLIWEAARVYAQALGPAAKPLVELLRDAASRR